MQRQKPFFRFSIWFFATLLAILAPIATVNVAIDPYDLLGFNRLGIYVSNERLAKPVLIRNFEPKIVLAGSSKVASISPSDLPGLGAFNAAFGAALPEEMAWFLDRYARRGETVLLGLDFYMFNETAFPLVGRDPFSKENRPSELAYIFDIDVFRLGVRSIVQHYIKHAEPLILPNGVRNQADDLRRNSALTNYDYARVLKTLRQNHYKDVKYSEARLDVLRKLKAQMTTRDVRLVVFINPLNVEVRNLIGDLAESDFQRFRRDVTDIFPSIYDLTGPDMSNRDYFYRFDPYHYLPWVGACFIKKIVAGTRPVTLPASPNGC